MNTDFFEISVLVTLAAVFGMIANKLRQPPLLGYIIAGFVVGALDVFHGSESSSIELFSKIGVTFLLFILGLELNLEDLKKLGKVSLITGLGQIIFTTIVGFALSRLQGFGTTSSLYISIALTFSSTIVIVKLLTTKREIHTMYGKISVGFLLVQDVAAMLILMGLVTLGASAGGESNIVEQLALLAIRIPALVFLVVFASKWFLPWLIKQTKHDREVLFIIMIAWALSLAALVSSPLFNFSIEIGALLAGIALSTRKESLQIESWTRSLRDFFLTIFFVLLGLHVDIDSISQIWLPSLIFSVFVLIGNPLIVMILMGALGYNKKIGFMTSLAVAQISEFSLLVGSMGLSLGHVSKNDLTILTIVGAVTMSISTYMIYYNETLYEILKPFLSIFEFRAKKKRGMYTKKLSGHTIIFGFHRLSQDLLENIKANPDKFLIVDHNPKVVDFLYDIEANVVYGDVNDVEIYDKLDMEDASLIISTVSSYTANSKLLRHLTVSEINIPVIVCAINDIEAQKLYEMGAEYVIYSYLLSSQKLKTLVDFEGDIKEKLDRLAKKEQKTLTTRLDTGLEWL